MNLNSKIFISGHGGMVGKALFNLLEQKGYKNLVVRSRSELDLLDQKQVHDFFKSERPEFVFHLAAKVGGIAGNKTYPADFIYENTQINTNVIYYSHEFGVKKLLNFGSVCIYPVAAQTPIKEEYLLTGPLEVTNEGYALAKISALMFCKKLKEQYGDNFISAMPANLYGEHDNFHGVNAHVIPMLMKRFHEAKISNTNEVSVWGSGKQTRDFLYSGDLADALLFLMLNYDGVEHINIGPNRETSIKDLAEEIAAVVGFDGKIDFDTSKPDGTPKRFLSTEKINNLGWHSRVSLKEGLERMYKWFLLNQNNLREK